MITSAIETFPDPNAWAEACTERLTTTLRDAISANGRAVFAGAGGSTPAPIYTRMARADLDWSKVIVTLVDERYVAETSPDSNARLLRETLLTGPAAVARFIPLYRPTVTVDRAAAVASAALREEGGRFDAVLLGMGEDGHICSMFPASPTLKTLLTPTLAPTVLGVPRGRDGLAPSVERLSVNLAYLAQAGCVILAITGVTKRAVFEHAALGDPATQPIAALVQSGALLQVLWTEAAP